MTPTIVYLRETSLLTDAEVRAYVAAQQIQLTRDFAPAWGLDAVCAFAATAYDIPDGAWPIILQDDATDADELGVHDDRGVPYGVVAVRGDPNWTVTASHETHEILVDPNIERTVTVGGFEYALEPDDACEDDRYAVRINGVLMSNSVTPAWFEPDAEGPYTIYPCAEIAGPLQLAPGGYIGMRPVGGEWSQRMARDAGRRQAKAAASRTMRRFSFATPPAS